VFDIGILSEERVVVLRTSMGRGLAGFGQRDGLGFA